MARVGGGGMVTGLWLKLGGSWVMAGMW